MKKFLVSLTFLFLFGPFLLAEEEKPPNAWINYLEGKDGIIQDPVGRSENLSQNFIIQQGDTILTNNSAVEIAFGKGNYLRLWKNSEAEFVLLENETRLDISGDAYLRIRNLDKEFTVIFAGSKTRILDLGLYRFQKEKNNSMILIYEGRVELEYLEEKQILKKKEIGLLNEKIKKEKIYQGFYKDKFDRFNFQREEELKSEESSYLPEKLRDYNSILNRYGRWVYLENDWCWIPYPRYLIIGWRPYYWGYWKWYYPWGYTWISYEPWGWVTYHYGWWCWDYHWGWYWRPGYYWRSAWVYWYWDEYYYGWAPWGWYNRWHPKDHRGWNFIRKDQIQKRDFKNILRKEQLKEKVNISPSLISQTEPTIRNRGFSKPDSRKRETKGIVEGRLIDRKVKGIEKEIGKQGTFRERPTTRERYYSQKLKTDREERVFQKNQIKKRYYPKNYPQRETFREKPTREKYYQTEIDYTPKIYYSPESESRTIRKRDSEIRNWGRNYFDRPSNSKKYSSFKNPSKSFSRSGVISRGYSTGSRSTGLIRSESSSRSGVRKRN